MCDVSISDDKYEVTQQSSCPEIANKKKWGPRQNPFNDKLCCHQSKIQKKVEDEIFGQPIGKTNF